MPVSVVTAVVILGALALWRRPPSAFAGRIARIVFLLTTLAIPVISFGLFEGLYNHVVKNLLYFSGAPPAVLAWLFPPPTYEMPNDVFFEITGVLQVAPAALAAWFVYRILRPRQRSRSILLQRGVLVASYDVTTIGGEVLRIPEGDRLVHVQFRRFAGCPVCDLHLHSFVRRHDELARAGIREVVVFHSTREDLLQYEADLPFAVVADADQRLYRDFGQIVACKYGRHAADDWSVDDVLSFAVATRAGTEERAWSAPAVLASWNPR